MGVNAWGAVEAGKYYTILADFTTSSSNCYLVESSGNLGFVNYSSAAVSTNYYWQAVADGNKFKFQSVTQPTKYLTPETGGLSTTAKSFTISTDGNFYHLYANVNNKGDRYIGTWGGSKSGFGNSGPNTGCFGTSHSHDGWSTYYTITEVPSVDVTYIYKYQGNEVARETTKVLSGTAYPTPTFVAPYHFTYTAPSGTVPETDTTVNIDVTASGDFPFEFSTSVDDAKWYTWKMANRVSGASYKGYVAYDASANMFLETDYDAQPTDASHLYAFVGNPFSFKILTANGQYAYTTGSNNSNLTRADEGTAFTARPSTLSSGATWDFSHYIYFSLPTDKTGSINEMSNSPKRRIGYWTGGGANDNGSLVAVNAVNLKVYPVALVDVPAGTDITFTNASDLQTVNNDSEYKAFVTTVDINSGNLTTYVSAPDVTDFSKSVTISGRTITVKYTTESAEVAKETFLRPVMTNVKSALDVNKGYPGQRVTTDLKAAYDAAVIVNESTTVKASAVKDAAQTLQTALDTYNASTTIYMPEDGKVYHINVHFSNGNEYYLYENAAALTLNTTANTASTEYPKTAAFVAYQTSEGGYTFKSATGYYLNLNDASSGKSVGTMTTAFNTNNSRVLFGCLHANTQGFVTLSNNKDLAYLKNAKYRDNDASRVLIVKESTMAYDGSSAPYYNGSFTSAVAFTPAAEMAYKLVYDSSCPDDAYISYNPGSGDVNWSVDAHSPYVFTEGTVTKDQLTAHVRAGYTSTITIDEPTKTITLSCELTPTTFTVYTVPTTQGGITLVKGGTTVANGETFQFVGEPQETTDFTAVAVNGFNSSVFLGDGTVTVVYNRPAQVLWETVGKSTGELYRIPAIGVTATGKLIAVTDKRWGGDIGGGTKTSLSFKTSTDNGVTWSDAADLATGTGSGKSCAFSDPAIIADRENANKVVAFSTSGTIGYGASSWTEGGSNYLAASRYDSNDGGETWTTTYLDDAMYQIFKSSITPVTGLFFSSGRILQSRYVKVGSYYRIYAALAAKPGGNRVVYSDDFGQTWNALGGINAFPAPNGDEVKVEELPDNRILLSSRKGSGRYFNVFTYTNTANGEGYWQSQTDASLSNIDGLSASSSPCNGEILIVPVIRKADATSCYIALQSVPTGTDRSNVTIFYKELADVDDVKNVESLASNWDGAYQVSTTTSAYSTMILQNDNNIGFFWENYYHNEGYDETYVSLPMELITRNQYSVATEAHRLAFIQSTLPGVVDAMNKAGSYVGQSSAAAIAAAKAPIASWTEAPTSAQLDAVFNIPSITIQAGNYYRFVNAYPGFETSQGHKKAIYNDGGLKWKQYDATDMSQVFRITSFENGVAKVIGVNDGFYPQAQTANDTAIPMSATENTLTVGNLATDQFSLKSKGSGNLFHCGGHNSGSGKSGNVVIWGGSANSCSAWYIEPVAAENVTFPITVSAAGYATYASAVDLTLPAEVEAYCATEQQVTGNVVMTRIEGEVPANEGVVLKAAAGNYTLKAATEATALETNYLKAAVTSTTIEPAADHKAYIFANGKNGVGFYILDSSSSVIAAHKSWLELPEEKATKGFIGFDNPTGIESIHNAEFLMHNNGKFLENGKIVIVKNNAKYNVAGQSIK